MVGKFSTVFCGQAGVQLSDAVLRQYCAEHGVSEDVKNSDTLDDGLFGCFLQQTNDCLFVLRNLSVDLESSVWYSANLLHPQFYQMGKKMLQIILVVVHYAVGEGIMHKVNDRMRKLVDSCDNVQGLVFVMNHSVGGGTGAD